ncbi:uncharacterized protein B0H18DRAFT_867937 [Fomitopsis serialis]|uniref:uncharacterized protein n=1 Tax=Fomitopsis serialis TaxID=139415 RepID=UPI0020083B4E|nr:uncharacterized protein B0H18DRAFT_867937 [Neoantrodia serialis]KAH9936433.1 hypothetical protein B0H18DRAFT_867937 [Neoantrodia serialis]
MADSSHESPQLTRRTSSPSRQSRRSSLSPVPPTPTDPQPTTALFPYPRNQQLYRRQNVPPLPVSALPSRDQPGPSTRSYGFTRPPTNLGSHLPSFAPSQYGSISAPDRPRTSHPVFHSTSDLVAHHGLPQSLPPVPRTTRYSSTTVSNSPSESTQASTSNIDSDFSSLCSNYLAMLNKMPEDRQQSAADAVPDGDAGVEDGVAVQALMEVLQASPEFQSVADFQDYLTSPMESPWDDFLTTPVVGSTDVGADMFTSPAIADADDFDNFDGPSLFGGSLGLMGSIHDPPKADAPPQKPMPLPATASFDGLYTMPSPTTPALDPASLHPSPRVPPLPASPSTSAQSRRRNGPTGTRKNITPESLVPMDAPIQGRKYVTPSSTSRKEVPAVFARKRARSQAFGDDDDDEIRAEDLPPQDLDAIEAKRRQNTLAARRSRKRKLEYQRELELAIEQERTEKEMYKARAAMFEALLRSHGHEVPLVNP